MDRIWSRIVARIRRLRGDDQGSAMIEFIALAVLLMIPLAYLIVALAYVQQNRTGVTQAAREAGRVYAVTGDASAARQAAEMALEDQHAGTSDLAIMYAAAGSDCESTVPPPLDRGSDFTVCVVRKMSIPGIPGFLQRDDSGNTVTGKFIVHVDEYRDQ